MGFPVEHIKDEHSPLFNSLSVLDHRGLVKDCPHCGEEFDPYETWLKPPCILQVLIQNEEKRDSAVVISECPKCHKLSWVHHSIDILFWMCDEPDSPFDKKLIQEEIERRKRNAKAEWKQSLCFKCKVKKKVEHRPYWASVSCEFNLFGLPDECKHFQL